MPKAARPRQAAQASHHLVAKRYEIEGLLDGVGFGRCAEEPLGPRQFVLGQAHILSHLSTAGRHDGMGVVYSQMYILYSRGEGALASGSHHEIQTGRKSARHQLASRLSM